MSAPLPSAEDIQLDDPLPDAKDIAPDVEPKKSALGAIKAGAEHGANRLLFDSSDELEGLGARLAASPVGQYLANKLGMGADHYIPRDTESAYKAGRDNSRNRLAVAAKEYPTESTVGDVTGNVANYVMTAPIGGGPLGRIATQAVSGALEGWGDSTADSGKDLAKDAATQALIRGGFQGVGEGIGALRPWITQTKEGIVNGVKSAGREAYMAGPVESARGALGNATMAANNTLKTARDVLASPTATAEMKEAAQAFLQSPTALGLEKQIASNSEILAPFKMSKAEAARDAYNAALAGVDDAEREAVRKALSLKSGIQGAAHSGIDMLPQGMTSPRLTQFLHAAVEHPWDAAKGLVTGPLTSPMAKNTTLSALSGAGKVAPYAGRVVPMSQQDKNQNYVEQQRGSPNDLPHPDDIQFDEIPK